MIARPRVALAEIGKIEPAMRVKHEVVRRRQPVRPAMRVEHARVAGLRVYPLNATACVIVSRSDRHPMVTRVFAAAVVADIQSAVGTDRQPVRTPACTSHRGTHPVRSYTRHAFAGDLGQNDGAIRHRHRTFGKPEATRHDPHLGHAGSSPFALANSRAGSRGVKWCYDIGYL